jgi:hypothetical protein
MRAIKAEKQRVHDEQMTVGFAILKLQGE